MKSPEQYTASQYDTSLSDDEMSGAEVLNGYQDIDSEPVKAETVREMGEVALSELVALVPKQLEQWEIDLLAGVDTVSGASTTSEQFPATTSQSSQGSKIDKIQMQLMSERTYAIEVETADFDTELTSEEIVERLELNHAVKTAPRLSEQVGDSTRTNEITYIKGAGHALHTSTSMDYLKSRREVVNEQQAIQETQNFLEAVVQSSEVFSDEALLKAKSILEQTSFIGEKEYNEATKGIATYWKALLERNPDQQILAYAGVTKDYADNTMIKSDEYLLDNILAHFDDEEAEKYRGRLITNSAEIAVYSPENLKVVLLDDWTISGSQLMGVAESFADNHPQFASCLEVQLIAASDERITQGLVTANLSHSSPVPGELPLPVRAYYRAHKANEARHSGTRITGAHSSVDYDFENELSDLIQTANNTLPADSTDRAALTKMPALTNIVRPYRVEGYEPTQKQRFATGISRESNPDEFDPSEWDF